MNISINTQSSGDESVEEISTSQKILEANHVADKAGDSSAKDPNKSKKQTQSKKEKKTRVDVDTEAFDKAKLQIERKIAWARGSGESIMRKNASLIWIGGVSEFIRANRKTENEPSEIQDT